MRRICVNSTHIACQRLLLLNPVHTLLSIAIANPDTYVLFFSLVSSLVLKNMLMAEFIFSRIYANQQSVRVMSLIN